MKSASRYDSFRYRHEPGLGSVCISEEDVMKQPKWIAGLVLVLGMAGTGLAQDRRELRHDYRVIERLRAEVQRDRMRLDEDVRRGHYRQANRDRAKLARDERRLHDWEREARSDRHDMRRSWR